MFGNTTHISDRVLISFQQSPPRIDIRRRDHADEILKDVEIWATSSVLRRDREGDGLTSFGDLGGIIQRLRDSREERPEGEFVNDMTEIHHFTLPSAHHNEAGVTKTYERDLCAPTRGTHDRGSSARNQLRNLTARSQGRTMWRFPVTFLTPIDPYTRHAGPSAT